MNTILGKGSCFEGTLEVEGDVRVDGTLKGKIKVSNLLTIGPPAKVEAEITTKSLILGGILIGRVSASDKVELQSKSVLTGDVTTKSLTVETGATFHGNCNMSAEEAPKRFEERTKKESAQPQVKA